MTKVTRDSIKNYYVEAIKYLDEAKKFVYIAIFIFFLGVFTGLTFPEHFKSLLDSFKTFAEHFKGRSTPVLILMIFLQNSLSALIAIWLGTLLGIIPLFGAITNGLLIGVVLSVGNKIDLTQVIWTLIPHGVFELPAIFLSWGLGIWRGLWVFRKNKDETYRERAKKAYHLFFAFILPLLIIAAIIEGLNISTVI
ncbi:MAG: stage II sporulation protein M [Nitrospirota bacterium]